MELWLLFPFFLLFLLTQSSGHSPELDGAPLGWDSPEGLLKGHSK